MNELTSIFKPAYREYYSPGIVDLGPQEELLEMAVDISEDLVSYYDKTMGRVQFRIDENELTSPSSCDSRLIEKGGQLLHYVNQMRPGVRFLLVERYMVDTQALPRTWHTDVFTRTRTKLPGGMLCRLELPPADPLLLSVNGPSTLCIAGHVRVREDQMHKIPAVFLPDSEPDLTPGEVHQRLLKSSAAVFGIGFDDQITDFVSNTVDKDPIGDYKITELPEGHLGLMSRRTLHRAPRTMKAGRTLLHFV